MLFDQFLTGIAFDPFKLWFPLLSNDENKHVDTIRRYDGVANFLSKSYVADVVIYKAGDGLQSFKQESRALLDFCQKTLDMTLGSVTYTMFKCAHVFSSRLSRTMFKITYVVGVRIAER